MLSRKLFASLVLVAAVFGTMVSPALAAPPDLHLWEMPVATDFFDVSFFLENNGNATEVFIGPGAGGSRRMGPRDVILTIDDNRFYDGPVTRLPNVLFTIDGNQMWSGRNTHGLQNVLFTLSEEDRIYPGPSTHNLSRALYTIRDDHVYEGPAPIQSRIVFTANQNLEELDPMTKLLLPVLIEGRF